MKDWKDIPEFKLLWDKAMKDYEYLKTLNYDNQNEFDTPEHAHYLKWYAKLLEFTKKYRKEHPEEFDKHGNFKQDT